MWNASAFFCIGGGITVGYKIAVKDFVGQGFIPRGWGVEKIPFGDLRPHIKCGPTVTAACKMPPYGDGGIWNAGR